MTVSTTTNKVSYIGNGVATSFAIPFPFLEKEHLKVRQLLNNVQTERSDWTLSGGSMVFATAPEENAQIVIMREVPLTQETDYRENEILPAETLERNFDKLTMQVQQLKEQADRAVTVDVFDDTDAASLIPSIRQAVSDCAGYVATATQKADRATQQAAIATQKASEATAVIADKANKDMDNLSNAGKKVLSGLALPSKNRIFNIFNSTVTTVAQEYTPPADGWIWMQNTTTTAIYISVSYDGNASSVATICANAAGGTTNAYVPAPLGAKVSVQTGTGSATLSASFFIYAKGSEV